MRYDAYESSEKHVLSMSQLAITDNGARRQTRYVIDIRSDWVKNLLWPLQSELHLDWHDAPVLLAWTRCNYGGARAWLVCRGCQRRVVTLYAAERVPVLRCRHCLNLKYDCQSEGRRQRSIRQLCKIRKQLDYRDKGDWWTPLPQRPWNMKRNTYNRLLVKAWWYSRNAGIQIIREHV